MEEVKIQETNIKERAINAPSGWLMFALTLMLVIGGFALLVTAFVTQFGEGADGEEILLPAGIAMAVGGVLCILASIVTGKGLCVLKPNEAVVYTLFGKYYGTLRKTGFYWVNPFCSANGSVFFSLSDDAKKVSLGRKLSLKAMTLNNEKQKVNDADGNPIEIGVVVIWRIVDTARAVFAVDNYEAFVSTQCDSSIRQVARQYPYDVSDDGDEKSLRGSSQEIAEMLQKEIQSRVEFAGIEILDARIAHLAYAPEIAAAMLQRQQASAIIVARQKIVEGAVGMVEMALRQLSENGVVELDEERKAQMVSNLLVVLCGNKDAQPIVNSGTIY